MKKYLLFLFALVTMATQAQNPGDIAQSYGATPGFNGTVKAIATQTDGKTIIGGDFSAYYGATQNKIIRLNTDGTKDTSFAIGSGFGGVLGVNIIVQQTDGKILVGGGFNTYNGVTENRIIRLNTDGTKDSSFNIGTGFNQSVVAIVQQTDGKILVGGIFSTYNGVTEKSIIRLNSDGTKDATFNIGTGFDAGVYTISLQTDGKILVGGVFTAYNGVTENRIIRLNSDGTKDATFITGTGFNNLVELIAKQADGKILVGGQFTTYKGVTENYFIRLNSDGSKDLTFATGTGFIGFVLSIVPQSDGKILVGGEFTSYNGTSENKIIRLNTDGSKDTSFNSGTGFDFGIVEIVLQTDGNILVGGGFNTYNGVTVNKITRLNTDGSKDTVFNSGTGFDSTVRSINLQTDGKILVGGLFTTYKGIRENKIIRLNTDGSKDTSFNSGTGFDNDVNTISQQTDGKILIGGNFITYKGITENRIIRLNTDGSKDTSFNSGTGFDATVYAIAIQADGKILVGGQFTTYNGVTENRIIRLNSDGTKDTTFNTSTGFSSDVNTIAQQADGKILIGGVFTSFNGVTVNRIIRLNTDGSKDTAFNTGTGFDSSVWSIKQQTDGKIVIGGDFTTYNGVTDTRIIRLNSDGSKDTAFNTGTGFNGRVLTIKQQADSKILVGGLFTTYNGITENRIITLNTNGTKDTAFITGIGFNSGINPIVQLADGKILVGGLFTTYKGDNSSARLIKLHTEQSLNSSSFDAANAFVIYPNPVQDVLHLQSNNFTSIKAVKIYDLQGKVVLQDTNDTINVSNLSKGLYIVKISTEEGEVTKKFIKE